MNERLRTVHDRCPHCGRRLTIQYRFDWSVLRVHRLVDCPHRGCRRFYLTPMPLGGVVRATVTGWRDDA